MGIVTSLHSPEIATLGIQEIPITGEEVQRTYGTNAIWGTAMVTTATAKTGIDTMKETAVMLNTEAIGTNLTGTATRRFFSSGCFIMTGINFRILKRLQLMWPFLIPGMGLTTFKYLYSSRSALNPVKIADLLPEQLPSQEVNY